MNLLIDDKRVTTVEEVNAAKIVIEEYKTEINSLEKTRGDNVRALSKKYREGGDKYISLADQFNKDIQKDGKTTVSEMKTFEDAMNKIDNPEETTILDNIDNGVDYIVEKSKQLAQYIDEMFDGEKV
jgi:hypothetical protein